MDEFEQYNLISDDTTMLNDSERYLSEPIEPHHKFDPLQWWQADEHRFPILRYMAFDLLAVTATSAVDERTFSKAGHVLNDERWHTSNSLAEAYQCLKSWCEQDLVVMRALRKCCEQPNRRCRRRQRQQQSHLCVKSNGYPIKQL